MIIINFISISSEFAIQSGVKILVADNKWVCMISSKSAIQSGIVIFVAGEKCILD